MTTKGNKKKGQIIERREMHPYSPLAMMQEVDNVFDAIKREFDDLFWNPFRPRFVSHVLEDRFRAPPMDLKDEGENLVLVAELPGMGKDDVDVTLTDDRIEIVAETKEEKKDEGECYICRERSYKKFKRVFEFPEEILSEKAEARLEDGVLKIVMPKKEPAPKKEARKLKIE